MASRARTRTPSRKPSEGLPTITLTLDGVDVCIDAATSTIRERWHAKEALRAAGLPVDDNELMVASTIWVLAKRSLPDLTLDDVLDNVTAGALMDGGVVDEDDPEASGAG
jgi:hypothetical protein